MKPKSHLLGITLCLLILLGMIGGYLVVVWGWE
jgi:uncharacterized protein YneF (UPF0154 family)